MENDIETMKPEWATNQPNTPTIEPKPEKKKSKAPIIITLIFILLLGAASVYVFINYAFLKDYFTGLKYQPSTEMARIESGLDLNDKANIIFKASFPVLESEEEFNNDCDSHDYDISVLGCFTNNQIYVYNIDSSEVPGILESTTAHELLHAIWSRLSGTEKARLATLLQTAYQDNKEMLEDVMKNYDIENSLDELYARIGTQARNVPDELEKHYALYFANRNKIVEYYESYIAPFNELKEKIDALGSELEQTKQEIDAETVEYENRAKEFETNVNAFNKCARTTNCFTESKFNSRRAELVAEEGVLDTMFENLTNKINEYNSKIEEYNSNIFKSNELQQIINSNSPPKATSVENE